MTTPVKQLKDTSGNTFYPQTAKAAISDLQDVVMYENPTTITQTPWVNTADIVDDAVTSSKIDFTTIKDQANNLPDAYTTVDVGYGIILKVHRIGNLVIVNQNGEVSTSMPTLSGDVCPNSMPSGFRPIDSDMGRVGGPSFTAGGSSFDITYVILQDGTIRRYSRAGAAVGANFMLTGIWITNDAWPTS